MSEPQAGIEALQQQLNELRIRCEDIARVVTAGYHENLFWLRKIHNSSAIYLGDNVAMTFLANGCRAYIDTRSRDVGVHLMHSGTWESHYTEAFRRLLRPGARVVDVGANLGWYSLVAAPIVGHEGRVYAVEPNPDLAGLVHASLRTNGFAGFSRVFQVAVGDAPGVVDLISRPDMSGGGYIREFVPALANQPPEGVRVAAMRLDDVLSVEPRPIDVVKMDIEGWEGMALRGMQGVLDRSPGLRMLVEWGIAQDASPAPRSESATMLAERGYLPFTISDKGALHATSWEAAVAMRELTNLVVLKADDPLSV